MVSDLGDRDDGTAPTTRAATDREASTADGSLSAEPPGPARSHQPEPGRTKETATNGQPEPAPVDLDAIEQDLDAVDRALDRLADGTYGTDEVTGEPIPDDVLETDPTARRA